MSCDEGENDEDRLRLRLLIDEGQKQRDQNKLLKAVDSWRRALILSDQMLAMDVEHSEENLLLHNSFASLLFQADEFDEAAEEDATLLQKLKQDQDLRDTEIWDLIQRDTQFRQKAQEALIYRVLEDQKPDERQSRGGTKPTSEPVSTPVEQKVPNGQHAKTSARPEFGLHNPSNRRAVITRVKAQRHRLDRSKEKSLSVDKTSSTAQDSAQLPNNYPKRSYSVSDLNTTELQSTKAITETTVDDSCVAGSGSPLGGRFLSDDIGSDMLASRADRWFKDLEEWTHNFVYGKESMYKSCAVNGKTYPRVRIAVLDTGIRLSTKEEKDKMKAYRPRITKKESFLQGESSSGGNIDELGHGTAVAIMLMKTCPNAEIYVARVARQNKDKVDIERAAVAAALLKAVDEWKVDIINMSFGWDWDDNKAVREALSHARKERVLLFASTSNFGIRLPNDILYPARSPDVIAIDAADGGGSSAPFNPTSEDETGKSRFTAPGIAVYAAPGIATKSLSGEDRHSGTSFASPIAAGIAALVLEFARQPPLGYDPGVEEHLKLDVGMRLILRLMSKQKGTSKFRFICPWLFLKGDEDDIYGGVGKPGTPGTRRAHVADCVVEALKKEFGVNIGKRMYPRIMQDMV